jgi:hypothetical protein
VRAALDEDIAAGPDAGLTSLPWIFINGRNVPRWQLAGASVLEPIVVEAARE